MRRLFLALLLACDTPKSEAPRDATPPADAAPSDAGLASELVMEEAPLDAPPTLSGAAIPGGARLERTGRALCPLPAAATVRAVPTGARMVSVFVEQRDRPGLTECRAKATVTVRGLEPGKWRIFVLGMGGRLDVEVDVPAP